MYNEKGEATQIAAGDNMIFDEKHKLLIISGKNGSRKYWDKTWDNKTTVNFLRNETDFHSFALVLSKALRLYCECEKSEEFAGKPAVTFKE